MKIFAFRISDWRILFCLQNISKNTIIVFSVANLRSQQEVKRVNQENWSYSISNILSDKLNCLGDVVAVVVEVFSVVGAVVSG